MFKPCKRCNKSFDAWGKTKFCQECRQILASKIKNCGECGKPFEYSVKHRKYCPDCEGPHKPLNPKITTNACPLCGQPKLIQSKHCKKCNDTRIIVGPNHSTWKGGRYGGGENYVYVAIENPNPPPRTKYVPEHRLIWKQSHNEELPRDWDVHHINGIKSDNRPENLAAYPKRIHQRRVETSVFIASQQRIRELEERI